MTETWKKVRTEKACAQPETPLLPLCPGRRTWLRDSSNEHRLQTSPCPYNLGGQGFISSNRSPSQPWASLITLPCLKTEIALDILHRCLLRRRAGQTPKLCFSPNSAGLKAANSITPDTGAWLKFNSLEKGIWACGRG